MDPLKAASNAAKQAIGQIQKAVTPLTTSPKGVTTPGVLGKLAHQSADRLLAEFMKLNINDPNNSAETQNQLREVVSQLRKQGVESAEDRALVAKESLDKTRMFAGAAKVLGVVAAVVVTVAAVSIAAVTFGAAAPLMVGAAAAGVNAFLTAGGPEKIGKAAQKFLEIAGRLGRPPTTDRMLRRPGLVPFSNPFPKPEGAPSGPSPARLRKLAESMQQRMEEGSEVIKTVMESKNQAVDAVMKMMRQVYATQTKVMSAGMQR